MVEGISFVFSASISFPQGVFSSIIVESVFKIHWAKLTPQPSVWSLAESSASHLLSGIVTR